MDVRLLFGELEVAAEVIVALAALGIELKVVGAGVVDDAVASGSGIPDIFVEVVDFHFGTGRQLDVGQNEFAFCILRFDEHIVVVRLPIAYAADQVILRNDFTRSEELQVVKITGKAGGRRVEHRECHLCGIVQGKAFSLEGLPIFHTGKVDIDNALKTDAFLQDLGHQIMTSAAFHVKGEIVAAFGQLNVVVNGKRCFGLDCECFVIRDFGFDPVEGPMAHAQLEITVGNGDRNEFRLGRRGRIYVPSCFRAVFCEGFDEIFALIQRNVAGLVPFCLPVRAVVFCGVAANKDQVVPGSGRDVCADDAAFLFHSAHPSSPCILGIIGTEIEVGSCDCTVVRPKIRRAV